MVKKGKNTVPWAYVVIDLNGDKIVRMFDKNDWKNQIKRVKKVIKGKRNKLYVTLKGFNNSFNS